MACSAEASAAVSVAGDQRPAEPTESAALCYARLVASETYGEAELDKRLAPEVKIEKLPPQLTGFPAWRRCEAYVESDADLDRGHADWVVPDGHPSTARILYLHGGGYEYYSPQDVYRPTTTKLASAAGMPLLCIDYRLCPEFRHPAQLEDAVTAFRWIAQHGPEGPCQAASVFLAGDSAGGGLALALALRLRDEPVEEGVVAGVSVVSPETDLSCSGESYRTRRWQPGGGPTCDPMFRDEDPAAASMPQIHRLLGEPGRPDSFPTTEPSISVLHADLHGLPPVQIHVGDAEVMLSDSVDFGRKAVAAGSPVEVRVWPHVWHTFTQFSEGAGNADGKPLEEALQSIAAQGEFLRRCATGVRRDGQC